MMGQKIAIRLEPEIGLLDELYLATRSSIEKTHPDLCRRIEAQQGTRRARGMPPIQAMAEELKAIRERTAK